jgi:thioredoxin 1
MHTKCSLIQLTVIITIALSLLGSTLSGANAELLNSSLFQELNDTSVNPTLDRCPLFVLDCYKPGCDPCLRMNASLSELSIELNGQINFGKINALENKITAEIYNVSSYPTLLLFENGTVVGKTKGYASKSSIVSGLRRLKPELDTCLVTPGEPSRSWPKAGAQNNCTGIKKADDPMLEAFVVSYCPFGLQMQRILLGLVRDIPDLSANIDVRYIIEIDNGSLTSMHGQKESDENLRQICIREEQPDRYWDYISCFLESGNFSQCLKSADVSENTLNACLAEEDRGLKYAMADFNETEQNGITGSPTLLINGKMASESDFGGRTEQALKSLICCGYASKPDFCSQNLSTEQARTGFARKEKEPQAEQPQAPKLKTIPLARVGENNPAMPVLVTDRTMDLAVQMYPRFVLIGFANWCGYCQMMNVTVKELSKQLQGQVTFGLMNAEENNETAEEYNLVSYPRLLIFNNETLVSTQTGYKSTSEFGRILEELLPGLDMNRSSLSQPSDNQASEGWNLHLDLPGKLKSFISSMLGGRENLGL